MLISVLLPIALTVVGVIMLVKLRFFFVLHPISTFRNFFREMKSKKVRRSFFLALAGTLGVGNIFGVAAGLIIGGPGTLFWLLISSFFSMIIKYSETIMVFELADEGQGMWAVLSKVYKNSGKYMATVYSLLTIALALLMGAALQSSALIDTVNESSSKAGVFVTIILVLLVLPCILVGSGKIDKITEIIIPMTTMIYISMCFFTILGNHTRIPNVISNIIFSAFSLKSCLGGVTILAIKEGFARGVLSNEAGVGTSALAHSSARERSPHVAGIFAMLEVFFDTTILCMMTGFAILLSVDDISSYKTPMSLVNAAFVGSLGEFAQPILTFCILSFAYATIICWYFYGDRATLSLSPKSRSVFAWLFLAAIAFSGIIRYDFLLSATDVILFLMSIMTLSTIIKKRGLIILASKNGMQK